MSDDWKYGGSHEMIRSHTFITDLRRPIQNREIPLDLQIFCGPPGLRQTDVPCMQHLTLLLSTPGEVSTTVAAKGLWLLRSQGGKNFDPILGDQQGVFILGRQTVVHGGCCPFVFPHADLGAA